MANIRVFVSFDYDNDKNLQDALIGQSRNSDSPFEVSDWSMKEAAPDWNWEQEAESRIKRADVVAVLVGRCTHCAPGVLKEVGIARNNGMRIFQLKPQYTNPTPVPNAGTLYDWTWDKLKSLLG